MDDWSGMFLTLNFFFLTNHPIGPGVYHGTLNFESVSDDLIDGAELLPYPTIPISPSLSPSRTDGASLGVPWSIALTEFHFILLYGDRIVGVSSLNEQLTYEEMLPLVTILCTHHLASRSRQQPGSSESE